MSTAEDYAEFNVNNPTPVDFEKIFNIIKLLDTPISERCKTDNDSRLIIRKIVNENFKSYAGVRVLGPFHKHFCAIVGPNGSGKSNVIDSLLFVFGFRSNRIRGKNLAALVHNSPEYGQATSCTVTVHFARTPFGGDYETVVVVPGSEFTVSRMVSVEGTSAYHINERRVQQREVVDLLKQHGIDLDHNRFLILQGEVEQISLMKPKGEKEGDVGMLEYLEDVIGSSDLREPIEQMAVVDQTFSTMRDHRWSEWNMAQKQLEYLREPRELAKRYVEIENKITILNHQFLLKKNQAAILSIEKRKGTIETLENDLKQCTASLVEKRKEIQMFEKSNAKKASEMERLMALKEKTKAEFDAKNQRDVQLQQEIGRSNKRRKELGQQLKNEEEKKIILQGIPSKNQETIADLEKMEIKLGEEIQKAEEKHAKVLASIQGDTFHLQEQKESLQKKLAELLATVNKAKAQFEASKTDLNLYTSRQTTEIKKLEDLKAKLEEVVSGLTANSVETTKLTKNISQREAKKTEHAQELKSLKQDESVLDQERRKLQITVEESRLSMQSNRSRGKVLDALLQAKQNGELPGVYGRMGDLGGIDAKYDIAISTAAGALDHIVVDNVDTAEACIMFLKKHDIGRASFIALDKQEHYKQVYSRPFKSPENVPRLFDLIQVADEAMRPAFYYALHDTLVASNLEQASRIAYGAKRYRVVTEAGELIEIAGTMSGGGRQVLRGRMGRTAEKRRESLSPKDMEKLEKNLAEKTNSLTEIRKKIASLEDEISTHTIEISNAKKELDKMETSVKAMKSQEPVLNKQLLAQQKKVEETEPEATHLAKLQKDLAKAEKNLTDASNKANVVENEVAEINAEIVAKTKTRLDKAQRELDEVTGKLDKVRQEKTKLRVAVTTAGRNLTKCETRIKNIEKEIESCATNIKTCAAEINSNEADAKATLEKYEQLDKELTELDSNNANYLTEMDEMLKAESDLKLKEVDLKEEVTRLKAEIESRTHKIAADKRQLNNLKLTAIDTDEPPELATYSEEEIAAFDMAELSHEIKAIEETLPKQRPNLNVLQEFRKQLNDLEIFKSKLDEVTEKRNKIRSLLDRAKDTRLTTFISGLSAISKKAGECYQMLADGGGAELETLNAMDPFRDGIKFTVRPPRKTWKEISYLSGGEKTIASLSLIFSLHFFKPTPIYFLDEIDSALDFRNTAIVGNYIREHLTQNSQFIVVTLRESMYQLCDLLIGIYKTENCTKCVTNKLKQFGKEPV